MVDQPPGDMSLERRLCQRNSCGCRRLGDGSQPESSRRRRELSIARDHNQVVDVQGKGSGKLDGVIGLQGHLLGQIPGARRQFLG